MVTGAARGLGNEFCKAMVQSCVSSLLLLTRFDACYSRGCSTLAIVDLKQEEASNAAQELSSYACCAWNKLCCACSHPRSAATSGLTPSDVNFIGLGCDVSSEISVQKAFSEVINTYGRVDSVVASAGKFPPSSSVL